MPWEESNSAPEDEAQDRFTLRMEPPPALFAPLRNDLLRGNRGLPPALNQGRVYVKQAGESLEMQNMCAEMKLRAERKAGELLKVMPKNPGGKSTASTMPEVGINYTQSSRWQKLATIEEQRFEAFITDTVKSGKELTTAAALRLAKAQEQAARDEVLTQESTTEIIHELSATVRERNSRKRKQLAVDNRLDLRRVNERNSLLGIY